CLCVLTGCRVNAAADHGAEGVHRWRDDAWTHISTHRQGGLFLILSKNYRLPN
ncbi:hypothetical protein GOODEAATRI_026089, partial [Goodea atripinnis]